MKLIPSKLPLRRLWPLGRTNVCIPPSTTTTHSAIITSTGYKIAPAPALSYRTLSLSAICSSLLLSSLLSCFVSTFVLSLRRRSVSLQTATPTPLLFLVSILAVREIFYSPFPRNVTKKDQWVANGQCSEWPCSLSRRDEDGSHFLDLISSPKNNNRNARYDRNGDERMSPSLIHLTHGFGSNSLTWLPLMQLLADKIACPRVVAADMENFGFGSRPSWGMGLTGCSWTGSRQLPDDQFTMCQSGRSIFVGHSMGSIQSLRLSRRYINSDVVLISPALFLPSTERGQKAFERFKQTSGRGERMRASMAKGIAKTALRLIATATLYPLFWFILRQIVASEKFWRRGLSTSVFDSKVVDKNFIFRYQLPVLAAGWERGLWFFCLAVGSKGRENWRALQDFENACGCHGTEKKGKVVIVHGLEDAIIGVENSRLLAHWVESRGGRVQLLEIEQCGHIFHEEKKDEFCETVQACLIREC